MTITVTNGGQRLTMQDPENHMSEGKVWFVGVWPPRRRKQHCQQLIEEQKLHNNVTGKWPGSAYLRVLFTFSKRFHDAENNRIKIKMHIWSLSVHAYSSTHTMFSS